MAVELFTSATEYVANELTILRGTVDDIVSVGVYHTTTPNDIPTVAEFTTVTLADGTADPPDPLAEGGKIDVMSLIGPRSGDVTLTPGDYQRYVLVVTATEDIIRRVDTVEVL
jgi:hypothetical protein